MANQVVIPVIIDDKGVATLGKISGSLDQLGLKSKQTSASMSSMWSAAAAGGAVAVGAISALGVGFAAMAAAAAKAGGAMADIAQKTGLSVEVISSLELAAKSSGSSIESMAAAVNKMQKAIVANSAAFQALGIDLQTFKALAPEKQFAELSSAILSLKSPAEQTAAAMAIFGKAGAELLPVMKAVAAGAGEMSQAIGGSLSGREVQSLDALDDSLTGLGLAWERLQEHFIAALNESGLLSNGIDSLSRALGELSKWITQNEAFFHGLAMALGDLMRGISSATAVFTKMLGLRVQPGSLLDMLYNQTKAIGQADMTAQAGALARAVTDANRAGIGAKPPAGSFAPGDAAAEKAASDEREAIWRAESTALAQEMAERTREYQKHYDAATDAALKAAEEQIKAELEIADEQVRAQQDAQKGVAEMGAAMMEAQRKAAKEAAKALERQVALAHELAGVFSQMGEAAGGAIGQVMALAAAAANLFVTMKQLKTASKEAKIGMAAEGAAGVLAAYKQGSVTGGIGSGAAGGAAIGSLVPGIGTVAGAVVGGIVGGLLGLFGKSKKAAEEAARELERVRKAAFAAADQLVEMGKRLEEMRRGFVDKAVSSLPSLFENFSKQADHSQAALDRLSRLGAAGFAALRAAGLSVVEAMLQMAPALKAAMDAAKASGTTLTGPLAELADFQRKVEKNKGTVDAVSALNDQIAALRAIGSLSQGLADDIAAQAQEQMAQLTAEGFTAAQALMLMAPALYQLAQAEAAGTIKVDAATQALIDQAAAAGDFEGMADPMAQLVELQQAMLSLWIEIAKVLGAQVPAAARRAADAIGSIPAPPSVPGGPPGPGETDRPGKNYRNEFAEGGVMRSTGLAMLHGTPSAPEYVFTSDQMRRSGLLGGGTRTTSRPSSIQINLGGIHGVAGTPEAIGEAVTQAIERGAVPRLRTALREVTRQ